MPTASSLQVDHEIIINKCRCDSVWCPQCFKYRKVKVLHSRINDRLDWRSTRHLILTIDRHNFKDGEEAYLHITQKKAIPQLIHNLKRSQGITIRDYVWVLEWHKDGFPHWHVFVDVQKYGREGMIYFDRIQRYWMYGNVQETYFKNEKHWQRLVGYFGKHGYFEKKKAHQAVLPEWAKAYDRTIKRTGSGQIKCKWESPQEKTKKEKNEMLKNHSQEKAKKRIKEFYHGEGHYPETEEEQKPKEPRKSYFVLFEKCGQSCTATLLKRGLPYIGFNINVPYFEMRKRFEHGEMRDGVGYVVHFSGREYSQFLKCYLPQFINN